MPNKAKYNRAMQKNALHWTAYTTFRPPVLAALGSKQGIPMKALIFIVLAVFSIATYAETLNEKVARNAANCLAGHAASNSPEYQSGETSKYIFLIESIEGSKTAAATIESSLQKVKSAVRMLGSTPKEEGQFLIKKFCPSIDEIISNQA